MEKKFRKIMHKNERGQAIILIAFAMIGLVAMVGLVTDTGLLLIEYGKLKRSVDAAAIAAAQQYSLPIDELDQQDFIDAATSFINLNQSQTVVTTIDAHSCLVGDPDRPEICNPLDKVETNPEDNRKLAEVTATADVRFGFLSVIGITGTSITASAMGEAATLDIVLVIDTSGSMAYETRSSVDFPGAKKENYDADKSGEPSENPIICNDPDDLVNGGYKCLPMYAVKEAALKFIGTLNFGYDRVGIVTLTGQQVTNASRNPTQVLELSSDKSEVEDTIENIRVYTPRICDNDATVYDVATGACILLDPVDGHFTTVQCHIFELQINNADPSIYRYYDPRSCPSSNVGGALRLARQTFLGFDVDANAYVAKRRLDAFWVAMVLMSGPANATDTHATCPECVPDAPEYEFGYCPMSTYYTEDDPGNPDPDNAPYPYKFCTDGYPTISHASNAQRWFTYYDQSYDISIYDPDDYARIQANNLANALSGTGVTIYTIGLGSEVRDTDQVAPGEPPMAEHLLEYIALEAGRTEVNHGQYFYAPKYTELVHIFQLIADNIATKISQ